MPTLRATLKAVSRPAGAEPTATVALTGSGQTETFVDGLTISHAIPQAQLAPGADVTVELADRHHPGDGQVTALAGVSASGSSGPIEYSGTILVSTDGSGNGTASISFSPAFASIPSVTCSANRGDLGSGTVKATAVTVAGCTMQISGASTTSGSIACAWDAQGT
ncbi:MAG TPA: H-type lectin domain-containing protein [Chloroflexota bacterium]|nr:H-type lectin domain-containing protein [Chloroflexota bacterium]